MASPDLILAMPETSQSSLFWWLWNGFILVHACALVAYMYYDKNAIIYAIGLILFSITIHILEATFEGNCQLISLLALTKADACIDYSATYIAEAQALFLAGNAVLFFKLSGFLQESIYQR